MLSALLSVLGFGLIFLLLVIAICLMTKIRIICLGEIGEDFAGCLEGEILFGGLRFRKESFSNKHQLKIMGWNISGRYWKRIKGQDKQEKKKTNQINRTNQNKQSKSLLTKLAHFTRNMEFVNKDLLNGLGQLVVRLWNSFSWDRLTVNGRYGFADPAVTGLVCGFIQSLARPGQAYAGLKPPDLNLEPDFTDRVFTGKWVVCCSFRPVSLLWALTSFLIKPAVKGFIWRAVKCRIRRKSKEVEEFGY